MTDTVTVGKRLIPLDQIAFVEPFDPAARPGMRTDRAFQARVVLLSRESVLTEQSSPEFAQAHGFRMLANEAIATNPAVRFTVETFEPAEGFNPTKPFATRLLWRDQDGNSQSKLLVTPPDRVLAIAVKGETVEQQSPTKRSRRRRSREVAPEAAPF